MNEALRAGVIGEVETQLVFRHDLVREAIYHDLPLPVRTGLHRDAGRALAVAGAPATQVATHLALGASLGDAEAVEWLRRAAQQVAPRAPGVAADLLGRAAELMDPTDPTHDTLLAEQMDALLWSGRMLGRQALATQVLHRTRDPQVEGRLRLSLGRALILQGDACEALALIETAPAAALTDRERVRLQAVSAWARFHCGDLDGTQRDASAARGDAERLGDDIAWCTAVSALAAGTLWRGHPREGVVLASQVVERAEHSSIPEAQWVAFHDILALCLIWADRSEETADVIGRAIRASQAHGNLWNLPYLRAIAALSSCFTGTWDDATTEATAALASAAEMGARLMLVVSHSILALVAVHRGQFQAAEAYLSAAQREQANCDARADAHWAPWARGLLHEARHRPDLALECLAQAWTAPAPGAALFSPLIGPDLVRLSLAAGKADQAKAVTEAVEAAALRMGVASARAAALRCRGLLEDDPETLLRAVAAARTAPRPFEHARTCEDAALTLAQAGDTTHARTLFNEALEIYDHLGAAYHTARATQAMRAHGIRKGARGPRKRPTTGWDALTDTEHRVVELAAEGLTNSQIATRLFVSHHTVATHLAHVYAKLSLTSRVELAAHATRRAS